MDWSMDGYARFTYNGTFSKPFMGYQPNSTGVQMRSIDIWRVKDGKLLEHWDELSLLDVFMCRHGLTPAPPSPLA